MATILIVDDDRKIIDMLRRTLTYEGYRVATAADGREALAQAQAEPPDLVVLDWLMPGPDGLEVAKRLRATSETRILMLTARDAVGDRVEGLDSGADDYLVKPFAPEELLARIRALLRRGRPADLLRLAAGDLDMDLMTRKVTRSGRTVELTVREFELLEYLLRHQGQVVLRDTLAREVWKETARGTPLNNVIDVHIARLRRKIDLDQSVKLIHTIRGVGFMLREGEP